MNYLASDYFSRLFKISSQIQVTSREGKNLGLDEGILRIVRELTYVKKSRRKVLLIGNGGSHSIVSHLAIDLQEGLGVRALTFAEGARLTALSNDYGYDNAFDHQLKQWLDPKDLVIAVSSSGQSQNIIKAVEASLRMEARVGTMTGFLSDNPLRSLGLYNVYVPSESYGQVELAHGIVSHYLSDTCAELIKNPESEEVKSWQEGEDDEKPKFSSSDRGRWVRRSRSGT